MVQARMPLRILERVRSFVHPSHSPTSLFPPSLFNSDDADHSGFIGLDEYISLLAELHSLTAAFRAHDPSGTGAAHLQYATFMGIVYAARN